MTDTTQQTRRLSFTQRVRLLVTVKLLVAFVLFGVLIGYVLFKSYIRQLRLQAVQATITTSKLEPCPDGMFSVDIRFSYTVDRLPYKSDKYRDDFGKLSLKKNEAEAILNKYPMGAQVEAWFDPEHPKYAVLDRSMGRVQNGFLIVAAGFAVILTLAYLWRPNRATNRSEIRVLLALTICLAASGCDSTKQEEVRETGGDYFVTHEMLAGAKFIRCTGRSDRYDDLQWAFQEEMFLITAGKNGLPPSLLDRLLPKDMKPTEISGNWAVANDRITFTEIKADGDLVEQPPRVLKTMNTPLLRIEAGEQFIFSKGPDW